MIAGQILHKAAGQLDELADASIHVVVTSPPYNLSYRRQRTKKSNLNGYGEYDDQIPEVDYQEQQVRLLDALGRVLTPGGSVLYNHKDRWVNGRTISSREWICRAEGLSLYQTITWDRGSSHNVDPVRLPPTTEYVFWLSKAGHRPRFNKACKRWGLVWRISPHAETARIAHPAPFPVAIPLRCIMLSDPATGDVVLDPYIGSGTTAVAAAILAARGESPVSFAARSQAAA